MAELKPKNLTLRCYAEREGDGSWFAMCVDLNLYARGDSFEEAKSKLHVFIHEYVTEALTVDSDYVGDLLPRLAPLKFRLRYHVIHFMVKCWRAADGVRRLFNEALPMVPC